MDPIRYLAEPTDDEEIEELVPDLWTHSPLASRGMLVPNGGWDDYDEPDDEPDDDWDDDE